MTLVKIARLLRRAGAAAVSLFAASSCTSEAHAPPRTDELPPYEASAAASNAVRRSLPLLEGTARTFATLDACSACHIQAVPSMTLSVVREHGFPVDDQVARAQAGRLYGRALATARSGVTQRVPGAPLDEETADPPLQLGLALAGLAASRLPSDDNTDRMAGYLASLQANDGRWVAGATGATRTSGDFAATAFAVRGISAFSPRQSARELAARVARARGWLLASTPHTTADKAYRLLGLRWSGAGASEIRTAAEDLLADQRSDGGWADGDPSVTGQVLVALHQAAGLPVTHPVYRRGARFLLVSQRPDGSWPARPPIAPCQGGASAVALRASSWATMALAELVAAAEPWERE